MPRAAQRATIPLARAATDDTRVCREFDLLNRIWNLDLDRIPAAEYVHMNIKAYLRVSGAEYCAKTLRNLNRWS